jgi:Rrf2 family nitric oxide-sensitive transcriptional repressor
MQMTKFTDYGLRVLISLTVTEQGSLGAAQIAAQYGVSAHHMAKIATALVGGGFVVSERGRNGGLRLARAADQISLGAVVRHLSRNDTLVDCLGEGPVDCCIVPACGLRGPLRAAQEAFYSALDSYSIADCAGQRSALRALLAS